MTRIARMSVIAAFVAAAALLACTSAEQADARSAVAATAAHNCSVVAAATRHRGKSLRVLNSADASKAQHMCHLVQVHIHVIRYWHSPKRIWTLYPRQKGTCFDLKEQKRLRGPLRLCLRARSVVRQHIESLAHINARLHPLLPKPRPHLVHDWLYDAFTCIHHYEGAWNANTGNGYYGGLQMDYGFMSRYGSDYVERWGTADRWPAWAQIDASIRAYRSGRGFYPWPNTARICGLL